MVAAAVDFRPIRWDHSKPDGTQNNDVSHLTAMGWRARIA